jgi:hypothetical protein
MSEENAAADYLIQFANNVHSLNLSYMNYINYRVESQNLESLTDEQKENLRETINNLRGYCILTSIQIKAINNKLKIKDIDDIKKIIDKIKLNYEIPADSDMDEYIEKVNTFLATNILQSMLESSIQLAQKVTQ